MVKYYRVGGAVRDELLGIKSKDIDFAVEADSFKALTDDLISQNVVIYQLRPQYLSLRAHHPVHGPADYTLCRKDGFYSDSRRPDDVSPGTILDDLSRRDFTVNAMALPVSDAGHQEGLLIDPFGGQEDLQQKLLRCVGDTHDRFSEDPLRILRAIRFHIVRGFELSADIENCFYDDWHILQKLLLISKERIYEELRMCFEHDTWATLVFLQDHYPLFQTLFKGVGITLSPSIPRSSQ